VNEQTIRDKCLTYGHDYSSIDMICRVCGQKYSVKYERETEGGLPARGGVRMMHETRFSDSSLYDEVCINCGETDGDGPITGSCSGPFTGRFQAHPPRNQRGSTAVGQMPEGKRDLPF
jgi:hypothetical protein